MVSSGRLNHTQHLTLQPRALSTLLQAAKAQPSTCAPQDTHQRWAAPANRRSACCARDRTRLCTRAHSGRAAPAGTAGRRWPGRPHRQSRAPARRRRTGAARPGGAPARRGARAAAAGAARRHCAARRRSARRPSRPCAWPAATAAAAAWTRALDSRCQGCPSLLHRQTLCQTPGLPRRPAPAGARWKPHRAGAWRASCGRCGRCCCSTLRFGLTRACRTQRLAGRGPRALQQGRRLARSACTAACMGNARSGRHGTRAGDSVDHGRALPGPVASAPALGRRRRLSASGVSSTRQGRSARGLPGRARPAGSLRAVPGARPAGAPSRLGGGHVLEHAQRGARLRGLAERDNEVGAGCAGGLGALRARLPARGAGPKHERHAITTAARWMYSRQPASRR